MTREWNDPIVDLAGAEAFFRGMGCTSFQMEREEGIRYQEYKALGIDSSVERHWRMAEFHEICAAIKAGTIENEQLCWSHSVLADYLWNTPERAFATGLVHELLLVTRAIVDRVPGENRIIVTETLVGRGCSRSDSPLYRALKYGMTEAVEGFCALVEAFLDGAGWIRGGPALKDRKAKVLAILADLLSRSQGGA